MLQVKRHLGQFQYFYWDFRAKDLPVCYSLKERYKLNQGIDSFLQTSAYTGTLHGYFHFYIGLVGLMTPCVSRHHNTQSRDDLFARFMRGLPFRAGYSTEFSIWVSGFQEQRVVEASTLSFASTCNEQTNGHSLLYPNWRWYYHGAIAAHHERYMQVCFSLPTVKIPES